MNSNPLLPVVEAYQVSMECFQLAKKVIKQRQVNWFADTQWLSQPQALPKITQAIDEVDDLFAFSLDHL